MKTFDTNRYGVLVALAAILLLSLLFFRDLISASVVLLATDDNVGSNALAKSYLPGAFLGWWYDAILLGMREVMPMKLKTVLLWLLPIQDYMNLANTVYLAAASLFMVLFLRAKGLRVESCLLGAVIAFWLASNFTLIYAGHLAKSGVLMFAAAFLWCLTMALKRRHGGWALLAGAALGNMFVEQPDVALFVACVLGPYVLFAAWQEFGRDISSMARLLAPLAFMAALFAIPPTWLGYQTAVRGVASMDQENATEKWNFCTQWSWPPEESIDFIAPGYMGWRSGEPEGPYWGRMGRSVGWEQTRQGFQNFKLENQYLGAIPLALAVFAVLMAVVGIRYRNGPRNTPNDTEDANWRAEIIFWGCAAVITLLLAFGKYFPLYYLFYQLPAVSSIRNPNKFLQIFQLAVAILAAYGFNLAIGARANDEMEKQGEEKHDLAQRRRGAGGS